MSVAGNLGVVRPGTIGTGTGTGVTIRPTVTVKFRIPAWHERPENRVLLAGFGSMATILGVGLFMFTRVEG